MKPMEAVLLLLCASHGMWAIEARGSRIRTKVAHLEQQGSAKRRTLPVKGLGSASASGTRELVDNVFEERGEDKEGNLYYDAHMVTQFRPWERTSVGHIQTRGKHKHRKPKRAGMKSRSNDKSYDPPNENSDHPHYFEPFSEDAAHIGETGPGFSTKAPSGHRPTNTPATFPTRYPTPVPTDAITSTPSAVQNPAPTQTPTIRPSPDAALTPSPTFSPTSPPSLGLTPQQPTMPPIPLTPGAACQTDDNGEFGSTNGMSTQVDYLYQMEIFPGITQQEATDQVEAEIVRLLLPKMFPEQCSLTSSRKLQTTVVRREYVGISTSPPDSQASGFACVGVFLEPCFVVRGSVTVFSISKSSDKVQEEVTEFINEILESGQLEEAIPDVSMIRSLRDRAAPARTSFAAVIASRNPSGESSSNAKSDTVPSSKAVDSTPSLSMTEETPDKSPFILRMPWWIWLLIIVFILIFWALVFAVARLLQLRQQNLQVISRLPTGPLK